MKKSKETFLKIGWRVKFRTRIATARMRECLASLRGKTARFLRGLGSGFCTAWRTAGYYICLALLLVVLGAAAYAYRLQKDGPEFVVSEVRNDEAVWSDFAAKTPQPAQTEAPFALMKPVPGEIIRSFDKNSLNWSKTLEQWQTHPGVDFAAEQGEVVCAAEAGTVIAAYEDTLWGNVIEIRHDNGWITRYAALNTLELVEPGRRVSRGETISSAANTAITEEELGVHVHFELVIDGSSADPGFGTGAY